MKVVNIQPIEKYAGNQDGMVLDVHSIFPTLQGEGPFAGQPAIFIRLAGCNLQCPGCDTEYTQGRREMTIDDISEAIGNIGCLHPGLLIVITGGEPFRQNLVPVCKMLASEGYRVQIETNGTMPLPKELRDCNRTVFLDRVYNHVPWQRNVYIVVSPKTDVINRDVVEVACAFKYVVDSENGTNRDNGLPWKALGNKVLNQVAAPPENYRRMVYIQPRDEKDIVLNKENINVAVSVCLEHGHTLQLQTHKLVNLE